MSMTVEDLLRPRYKVIADYPNTTFTLGFIKEFRNDEEAADDDMYKKYPHLFKKLEWWEERKESDMPEYVKRTYKNYDVLKVKRYIINSAVFFPVYSEDFEQLNYFLPATKEEFDEYESP